LPKLAIGMPVYNAEAYLEDALDSLIAQDFKDFEIIISDNASIDRTAEICQEYCDKFENISYYRNEANLGAAENFNRVFSLATSEYFKWAAYDDICAPGFLTRCVEILDNDDTIGLCCSRIGRIDDEGQFLDEYTYEIDIDSVDRCVRFNYLVSVWHDCIFMFGVFRSSLLVSTGLIGNYEGSDRVLLAGIGLLGRIHVFDELLFYRRDHKKTSIKLSKDERRRWYDPSGKIDNSFSSLRILVGYFKCIGFFKLGLTESFRCYASVLGYIRLRRYVLTDDIKGLVKSSFGV
jgi:glycosyltransferase involved in cell wall biosynthesis